MYKLVGKVTIRVGDALGAGTMEAKTFYPGGIVFMASLSGGDTDPLNSIWLWSQGV